MNINDLQNELERIKHEAITEQREFGMINTNTTYKMRRIVAEIEKYARQWKYIQGHLEGFNSTFDTIHIDAALGILDELKY